MKALMLRMRTQLNAPALPGVNAIPAPSPKERIDLGLAVDSPRNSPIAMLDGTLKDRWFRTIEEGVLGRFAASSGSIERISAPVVVGFVHGEEIPWYGSLQVHGYDEDPTPAEAQVHLMVAPRFGDGSFLHVGLTFDSISYWREELDRASLSSEEAGASGRQLTLDFGYSQESYGIQAQYSKSSIRTAENLSQHLRPEAESDGFHIRGAWRITGGADAKSLCVGPVGTH